MVDDQDYIEPVADKKTALLMLSRDSAVRKEAIDCLCRAASDFELHEYILEPLLDQLGSADPEIQQEIIRALPDTLRHPLYTLIELLTSHVDVVRDVAIDVLREARPNYGDLMEIAVLLQHPDKEVRICVAEFLQGEGQERMIPENWQL